MYHINNDVLDLFLSSRLQVARIEFYGQDETIEITDEDILQGGLTIDRYSVSGNKLEVGSAIASEMSLELLNTDGKFNDVRFEGGEMYVEIGVEDDGITHYIPMGYFTVDNIPRKLATMSINALDRMVRFDKPVEELSLPATLVELLEQACDICNVDIATDTSSLTNRNYEVKHFPEVKTYRQIIQWIGELTGTCAYIDWEGKLRLEWYVNETGISISEEERFSSDLQENDIQITGVLVRDGEEEELAGASDYALLIEGNELINGEIAETLSGLINFTYRPYSCTVLPYVHLYPLDKITFVKQEIEYNTIITNFTYTMNGGVSIEAKGETFTNEGYASANPLTKREKTIISTIENIINEKLNDGVQSVISLNEAIAGSLGLHMTAVTQTDGSMKYYFHTNSILQDSEDGDVIYTVTGGGFAVSTTGWNDGSPVWTTGFTKEGNAVFNFVSANGIEVSDIDTEYRANITPEAFDIWYRGMKMISANADESKFTKLKVDTYAEVGRVRIIPHTTNGVEVGTNIVFLD